MTAPPRRAPAWLLRLHRLVLRAHPAERRKRYGDEMESMLEAAWSERARPGAGALPRLRLVLRSLCSLALHGVLARVDLARETAGGARAAGRLGVGRGDGVLRGLARDLRVAARSLRARPAHSAVVVATLTLGIGANVSIFSFVNGLLLRPLPYGEPERLVQLTETAPDVGTMDVSYPDFRHWSRATTVFSGMFAFDDTRLLLTGGDRAELVEAAMATPGFLGVLAVEPALGRDFLAEEGEPGADAVIIVGFAFWRDRLGADPNALGRTLLVDGRARTLVGVAPPGFRFPEVADAWVPLAADAQRADPDAYEYDVIARLKPGRTLEQARAEGSRIAAELARRHPDTKAELGADVYPLRAADVPPALAQGALMMLAAVTLVSLIACVNVAHLLLARGEERRFEIAVRRALGASRGRLVRQLLAESGLLSAVGGAAGVALAVAANRTFPRLLPDETPFWLRFELDGRVLAWAAVATVVTCLLCGLAPALRASRVRAESLRSSAGVTRGHGRQLVVSAEVALALVLLIGSGLMIRALAGLASVEPGFDPDDVLVLSVVFPPDHDRPENPTAAVQRALLEAVAAEAGVRRVAATSRVPLLGGADEVAAEVEDGEPRAIVALNAVTEDYFETMGIPLVAGRGPTATEVAGAAPVAVVSRALAERLWPGADPLGRRLRHGVSGDRSPHVSPDRPWRTVVGVAGDVRIEGLASAPRDALYVPHELSGRVLTLVARTAVPPLSITENVRARIGEIDAGLPVLQPTTMEEAIAFSTWTERLVTRLLTAFGALALVLTLIGVHGVVAYLGERRRREIGLRLALGATPAGVSRTVAARTAAAVALGLAIGCVGGIAAARALSSLLHGVAPGDPATVATAAILLGAAGFAAAYLPARRAAAADPSTTLREGT